MDFDPDEFDACLEWLENQDQSTKEININDVQNNNGFTSIPDSSDNIRSTAMHDVNLLRDKFSEKNSNSSNNLLDRNNQNQMVTTTNFVHASHQYQVPQLLGNQYHPPTPIQYNRLNRTPMKDEKSFRENERRLLGRNVPRFMILHSDSISCLVSCALHMLLNAPVFVRKMSVLQNCLETNSSNLHLNSHIPHERNFFDSLSSIVKAAYKEYQNDDIDVSLVRELWDRYELYSPMRQLLQQDNNEFLTCLMDTLRTIANQVHQTEMKHYDIIHVLSNECDFQQYVDEHTIWHNIKRIFDLLPELLLFFLKRTQNNQSINYTYPKEFATRSNQRYLLTGAIVQHDASRDHDHFIAVARRQDVVYLLDGSQIIDRFDISGLSEYFKKVFPRILLYNEVDPLRSSICIFEDPLCGEPANEAFNNNSISYETKQVAIPIQPSSSVMHDLNTPIIIRHPITSIIRSRMPSDSQGRKVNAVSKPKDCLDQDTLYFWPYKKFVGYYLECTLIFIAPDGQTYRSHYQFVRNEDSKQKIENPTYFNMDEINPSDDQWFRLSFGIIRQKLDVLKAKTEKINETNEVNQYDGICQLVRYPDDQVENIDQDRLLSIGKTGKKSKKKASKKVINNSRGVSPARLSKAAGMNTLRLAMRRVWKQPDTEKYVPVSDVLFCSNPVKLVSSTFKEIDREYDSNLLQITEISPSQISLPNETDQCTIKLSYTIPKEMYECTSLKDKYLKATIVTGTDKQPDLFPHYQILDNQNRVNYKKISVNKYCDEITLIIVKRPMTDDDDNSNLNQTSNDLRFFHNTSPIMTQNSSTTISANPSMNSFRIQLELCHLSNNELIPYPKSKVTSEIIIDGITSEEEQVFIQPSESDHDQTNDINVSFESFNNDMPFLFKRQLSEENDPSIDTFMVTHQKQSRIEI